MKHICMTTNKLLIYFVIILFNNIYVKLYTLHYEFYKEVTPRFVSSVLVQQL